MRDHAHSNSPFVYRINNACAKLQLSRSTVYRLIESGQLDRVRISKRNVGIPRNSLVKYAASCGIEVTQ